METKLLVDDVTATGNSDAYFVGKNDGSSQVQVFISMTSGTVTCKAGATQAVSGHSPIADAEFTASVVTTLDLSEGSYLSISYDTAVDLTVWVKPMKVRPN